MLSLTGVTSTAFAQVIEKNGDGTSGAGTVQGTLDGAWISKYLDVPTGADVSKIINEEYLFTATLEGVADHTYTDAAYNGVRTLSTTAKFASLTPGEVNKVLSGNTPGDAAGNILNGVLTAYPHAGEYIYTVKEVKPSEQVSPGTDTVGMIYSAEEYQMRVWVKNTDPTGVSTATEVYAATVFPLGNGVVPGDDNDGIKVSADNTLADAGSLVANKFTFNNEYTVPVTLKTTKVIAGDWADFSLKFPFTVAFTLPKATTTAFDVEYVVGSIGYTFDADGKLFNGATEITTGWSDLSFAAGATTGAIPATSIGHNETIYFRNIPLGTTYTASEADSLTQYAKTSQIVEGTNAAITGNAGLTTDATYDISVGSDASYRADFVAADGDNSVTVTNTRTNISITGIVLDNLPFILIGLAALVGLGFYLVSRARRRAEEE